MKNQTIIIAILFFLILILSGVGYVMIRNQPGDISEMTSERSTDASTSMNDTKSEDLDFTGKIADLLSLGNNAQCEYEYTEGGMSYKGNVYITKDGNKFRGDFILKENGTSTTSSAIQSDGYAYTWSSAMEQGVKMKLEESETVFGSETEESEEETELQRVTSPDQNIKYKCKPWIVDNSVFEPPADIEFIDYTQSMEQMEEFMEGVEGMESDCSTCDLLSGSEREQCLQALGC